MKIDQEIQTDRSIMDYKDWILKSKVLIYKKNI